METLDNSIRDFVYAYPGWFESHPFWTVFFTGFVVTLFLKMAIGRKD